jgi:uncharacterized protein
MDAVFPIGQFAFQVMTKPIGPVCNLNCTYCYYLEKKKIYRHAGSFIMPDDVLERFTKEYIGLQTVPVVSFVFQGGEPAMLGVDFLRKAIAFQKKYARGKQIQNSFQTNGTLLTDELCLFLKENNFLVGLSVDGPAHLHDRHRRTAGGGPSHEKVMEGLRIIKKHGVEFNTLTVVNRHNGDHPLDVYNFLKGIGSRYMQFIPIVERRADQPGEDGLALVHPRFPGEAMVTEWSVGPLQYGRFMSRIFDEWVRKDVGRHYVQLFDATLANWVGQRPGICVFEEKCGDAAVLEHNGDLYTCDHFVYPDYFLGNILEKPLLGMLTSERQKQFGLDKREGLPGHCLKCKVRFACQGECPKNRFLKSPEGEEGLNYLCEGYKHFFGHIAPYMAFMANELKHERPPANVMQAVKKIERQGLRSMRFR